MLSLLFITEEREEYNESGARCLFVARWRARNAVYRRLVYLITRAVLRQRFAMIYGEIVTATFVQPAQVPGQEGPGERTARVHSRVGG